MSIYEYDEKEHIRLERAEAKEEGLSVGEKLGESKFASLIDSLLKEGKTDAIALVTKDEEQREKWYKEYHIE